MVRNWNGNLFFSLIWIAVTIPSVYPKKTRKEYNTIIFCFLTRYWCWINACFCVLSVRSKIRSWNALSGPPFKYEESSWKPFFISLIINQCFSGIAERNDSRIFNLTKFLGWDFEFKILFYPEILSCPPSVQPGETEHSQWNPRNSRPLPQTVHTKKTIQSS